MNTPTIHELASIVNSAHLKAFNRSLTMMSSYTIAHEIFSKPSQMPLYMRTFVQAGPSNSPEVVLWLKQYL